MSWKKNITDVKIVCKRDGAIMVLESTLNDTNGIYICTICGDRINLKVNG